MAVEFEHFHEVFAVVGDEQQIELIQKNLEIIRENPIEELEVEEI